MIIKYNKSHKKNMISDIITKFIQLLCTVLFFISQLFGNRRPFLLFVFASVSVILLYLLVFKFISIYKKVYVVIEDNKLTLDNKSVTPKEIHSISITETFVSFKIRKYKSFVINLRWVDEDDKVYLTDYFYKLNH